MTVRDEIATAASTVTGVTCTPYFRQTTKPGDAMVRLDRIDYPNKFAGVARWQVLVLLAQDLEAAEKQLEALLNPLRAALGAVMQVTAASPQQLALDTGAVPALVIEGTRESE